MSIQKLPILYSFRRCPYAMRARVSLYYAQVPLELREVVLKNKPQALLDASPKATVPVLVLPSGQVREQSLDIVHWALEQSDPDAWLPQTDEAWAETQSLIEANDSWFKQALDRYKYADRYPEQPPEAYRLNGEVFLSQLERRLAQHPFLAGPRRGLADVAIFPFIRQFAHVDKLWFNVSPYPRLRHWLDNWLEDDLFTRIMRKYPAWQAGDPVTPFPAHRYS